MISPLMLYRGNSGPWQNKMKQAASSSMATTRMSHLLMTHQPKPTDDPTQPFSGVEVEVQDDAITEGEQPHPPAERTGM